MAVSNKNIKPQKKQQPGHKPVPKKQVQSGLNWKFIGGIVILVLIGFWPAFYAEFTNWDDGGYVTENNLIRHLDFPTIKKIFSLNTYIQGNYHPLTILTYTIEYHFFELKPFIYHFDNIILHTLNSILVFLLVRKLSKKDWAAFITAVLFGIHPLHVESVAWVSERKDVLYTFFFLLSCISYLRYRDQPEKKKDLWISLFLFFLSCLSKGQAVILPVVLLLFDFYHNRQPRKNAIIEKIPFFIVSLIFGIIAVMAQKSSDAIQSSQWFSIFERICFASYGMIMYLVKLVVPFKLSCFYPYPVKVNDALPAYFYACPVIAAVIFAVVLYSYRRTKVVVFGFLFFFLTILLVLQLLAVGSTIMSDRYSYIPFIGIFFITGYGMDHLRVNKSKFLVMAGGTLVIYSMIMIYLTREQCRVWNNSLSLWENVIKNYKNVAVAYNNKGLVYKAKGETDKANYNVALNCYNLAIEVDPAYPSSYENRGNIFFLTGHYQEAIADFNKAMSLKATEVAYNSRGAVYFNMGKYDQALADFNKAISIKDDYLEAHRNRGNAYSVLGQYDKALIDYEYYLRYDQKLDMIYFWKGIAEYNLKKYPEAINDFSVAISRKPQVADFYLNRSRAFFAIGDKANALRDADMVKSLNGAIDENYYNSLK